MPKDIYQFIKEEEIRYSQDIEVMENWSWNMKEHIRVSLLFKHGKFARANNELATKSPNRNIVYPLLNLRYRAEDLDVKDVVLYVDDPALDHLSFLVKKYHDEVYVRERHLDTFFDEIKEEKIDFGGVLVRITSKGPVHEPMESIVFCDQTNLLSGPLGFKMFFAPDELYDTAQSGWGETRHGATITLDELVMLAERSKQLDSEKPGIKTQTPGKYIEVYRVHGALPREWLDDGKTPAPEDARFVRQMHIVAFYQNEKGEEVGVTLYRAKEASNPFRVHLSGKKIRNRGLAYGGVEELFDPQIWTNYSEIRKKEMLDSASKVVFQTTDDTYADRNQIKDMDNLEVTVTRAGTRIDQVPTGSPNITLFNEWIREWDILGQTTSGATEVLMGKTPPSGTPFRAVVTVAQQGLGLHTYRQGKFATFLQELYQESIIPDIVRTLSTNGARFMATLNPEEMVYITDRLIDRKITEVEADKIFRMEVPTLEERELLKNELRETLEKKGNRYFFEILKGELKDKAVKIKINIGGKQKDLVSAVDKMVNVFQQVLANPQVLENPRAAKIFNKLIEYSGLDPIDFGYTSPRTALPPPPSPETARVLPKEAAVREPQLA